MKLRRFFSFITVIIFTFFGFKKVFASGEINLYLFWTEGCPHCKEEKEFLQKLLNSNDDLHLHSFEVSKSRENQEKLNKP